MLLTIMLEVTPLAEGSEVARAVVGRIVVPMSGREHHVRGPDLRLEVLDLYPSPDLPPFPVSPGVSLRIPPAPIP